MVFDIQFLFTILTCHYQTKTKTKTKTKTNNKKITSSLKSFTIRLDLQVVCSGL